LIVDPGDLIFHLKVPLFISIFSIWLILKSFSPIKLSLDIIIICFLFITIPLFGIVSAVLQNNFSDSGFAIGFVKSFIVILLIFVILDLNIAIEVYLIKCSIIIPLIIIPIYVLLSFNPDYVTSVYNYMVAKDVAKFSLRDFYGYKVVMLYYRTSPLLVFPLAFHTSAIFNQKRFKPLHVLLAGVFLFTLILSGTRANILIGVFLVIFFLISYFSNRKNKFPLIIIGILILYAIVSFAQTLSFDKKDVSSDVKSGHLDSYILLFDENPEYFVWGQGLGGRFYSQGNQTNVVQTELSYIDLVRWFGVPVTLIMFFLLLYPLIKLYGNDRINIGNKKYVVAYLGYLFIAGTNPLLISSTGMLSIIIMYSLLRDNFSPSLIKECNLV
jgi:hypothetical protein